MIHVIDMQIMTEKETIKIHGTCVIFLTFYHMFSLVLLYLKLLINLLVYSIYTENLVCVILVTFLYNGFHPGLIQLTSHKYG